jgi:hypothetical protein
MNLLFNQRIRFRFLCLLKLDSDKLIYGNEPGDVWIGIFTHMSELLVKPDRCRRGSDDCHFSLAISFFLGEN